MVAIPQRRQKSTIDLETDEGKDQFHNLVEETDLILTITSPGRTTTRHHLRGHPHHFTVHCSRFPHAFWHHGSVGKPASERLHTAGINWSDRKPWHTRRRTSCMWRRTRRFRRSRIERTSDTRNHPRITKTGTEHILMSHNMNQ